MKRLQSDHNLGQVDALLLADGGSAALNPPEWVAKLNLQVNGLSIAAGDKSGGPDAKTLAAPERTYRAADGSEWMD